MEGKTARVADLNAACPLGRFHCLDEQVLSNLNVLLTTPEREMKQEINVAPEKIIVITVQRLGLTPSRRALVTLVA